MILWGDVQNDYCNRPSLVNVGADALGRVVGRMSPLTKTCDSVTLHVKGNFVIVIKFSLVRWGDSPGGPSLLTSVLTSQREERNAYALSVAQ